MGFNSGLKGLTTTPPLALWDPIEFALFYLDCLIVVALEPKRVAILNPEIVSSFICCILEGNKIQHYLICLFHNQPQRFPSL
jgi:hypothetical protein